jgi:hypothetical protein
MITTDAPLLQSILKQAADESLALTTAQRLNRFIKFDFNPRSDDSWETADKLWRAALLTRDVERMQP